jgi:hypothetical protein
MASFSTFWSRAAQRLVKSLLKIRHGAAARDDHRQAPFLCGRESEDGPFRGASPAQRTEQSRGDSHQPTRRREGLRAETLGCVGGVARPCMPGDEMPFLIEMILDLTVK